LQAEQFALNVARFSSIGMINADDLPHNSPDRQHKSPLHCPFSDGVLVSAHDQFAHQLMRLIETSQLRIGVRPRSTPDEARHERPFSVIAAQDRTARVSGCRSYRVQASEWAL
jgi:hypothetical protein